MTPDLLSGWLFRILAFGIAFGLLVFVHEAGHYVIAKLCGVTVEVFSFGFGRRLFGFRRKGTDYRVSLVPLGGYVKMLGETPEDPSDDPGAFSARPKWQRFLVLVAGAAMNIVLAVACYTIVFSQGDLRYVYLDEAPVIGGLDEGLPAASAGLLPGDRILSIDGTRVDTWEEFKPLEMISPDRPVTLRVERAGSELEVRVTATSQTETITNSKLGLLGLEPRGRVVAVVVSDSMPASEAGMRVGDFIVSIDGVAIDDRATLIRIIRESAGRPLAFVLEQDGKPLELTIAAIESEDGIYRTGFIPDYDAKLVDYSLMQALPRAVEECRDQTLFTYLTLKKLVTRSVSIKQMSGPIGIFQFTGKAAETGWLNYMRVIGLISLQLGIINLLPIPVLDGGHIFILLVEGVMRRDLSDRLKERMIHVGFIFLMMLMAVVIFNDISKNVPGGLDRFLPWGGQ